MQVIGIQQDQLRTHRDHPRPGLGPRLVGVVPRHDGDLALGGGDVLMTEPERFPRPAACLVQQGEEEAVPQPPAGIQDRLHLGHGQDPRQLLVRLQRDGPAAVRPALAEVVQERLPAAPPPGPPGREQVAGYHMFGDVIGMDGIGTGRHGCQATALEDSEVCVLPFNDLETLSRSVAPLQRNLHQFIAREISRDHNVMLLLGSMRAEERLAAFLLNLSQRYRERGYSSTEFVLRMSREEIGSYLGLKLETISWALFALSTGRAAAGAGPIDQAARHRDARAIARTALLSLLIAIAQSRGVLSHRCLDAESERLQGFRTACSRLGSAEFGGLQYRAPTAP